jgi:hypothetical protein
MAGWKKLLTSGDVVNADLSGSAGITGANIANDAIDIDHLSASGTAGATNFLRGDNSWVVPTDTNTNQLTTFTVSATTDTTPTTISQGDDLMIAAGTGITAETTADGTVTITNTVTGASTATASATGVIKLEDDTEQSVAANLVSATASRTYGIQLNSSDQAVVNVPWTDTAYTLPEATTTVRGGIELFSDTDQSVSANLVSTTASRTYGLQLNSDGQGVVNVPWTDTDTNTNQLTTFTVSATTDTTATTISQGDDLFFAAGNGITCETTADGTVTIVNSKPDVNHNTDEDVSVANLHTALAGGFPSNAVTIGDSSDVVTIGNDLIVTGDLTVSGDTTTLNIDTLSVEDKLVILSSGAGGGSTAAANASGLSVNTGEAKEPSLKWYKDAGGVNGPFHWAMQSRNDLTQIGVAGIQVEVTTGSPSGLEEVGGLFAYNSADGTMYFYDDV